MNNRSLHHQFHDAWKITFRNPALWLLGLFASLTVTNGFFESGFRNILLLFNLDTFFGSLPAAYQAGGISDTLSLSALQSIQKSANYPWNLFIIIAVLVLIMAIAVIAQITMILNINRQSGPMAAAKSALYSPTERTGRFWDTLFIQLIFKAVSIFIFMLIALPLMISLMVNNYGGVLLSTLFFFFIFIPVALGLTVMRNFAVTAAVLEQRSAVGSITHSWKMLRKNMLISFESVIYLLLLRVAGTFVVILILAVVLLPAALVTMILLSAQYVVIASIFAALLALVAVGFVLAVRGMYATYEQSVWVLVFKRIDEETIYAKLVSVAEASLEGIFSLATKVGRLIGKKSVESEDTFRDVATESEQALLMINQMIKKLEDEYGLNKTKAMDMKKELIKMAKKEQREFMPSLKKAIAELEHQYKVAKPKAIKLAKAAKAGVKAAKREIDKPQRPAPKKAKSKKK